MLCTKLSPYIDDVTDSEVTASPLSDHFKSAFITHSDIIPELPAANNRIGNLAISQQGIFSRMLSLNAKNAVGL